MHLRVQYICIYIAIAMWSFSGTATSRPNYDDIPDRTGHALFIFHCLNVFKNKLMIKNNTATCVTVTIYCNYNKVFSLNIACYTSISNAFS